MLNILKKNYFLLISTFLVLYFFFNFLEGERGLFSYFKKQEILINLLNEKADLSNKIKDLEFKNSLLLTSLDLIQSGFFLIGFTGLLTFSGCLIIILFNYIKGLTFFAKQKLFSN